MKMNKLAVYFPGIGYTLDKPLMHYSRRLAERHGYGIKLLPYDGFPTKIMGDRAKMEESFYIALKQSEEMLKDLRKLRKIMKKTEEFILKEI